MKQKWLDIAEILDAYRTFPRLFLAGYAWILYDSYIWYKSLPDPTGNQSLMISAVWGASAIVTAWYFNTGRKW